jgi:HCOMODA/2-hydroxy-3-carboxy-muconic semialdehyde decarboxylase
MALSTLKITPRPRHGTGTYFAPQPPLWDDPMLVRSDDKAQALTEQLGAARAIVMRGNGAVCVGASIEEAACIAYFLEDAAAVELAVLQVKGEVMPATYTAEEVAARAVSTGGLFERMWEFLTFGDPENT